MKLRPSPPAPCLKARKIQFTKIVIQIMEDRPSACQNGCMITDTLRQQHQEILKMLDRPELAAELIHFVESVHHPLEEKDLFPFLDKQKCLSAGGPKCSFFMGLRLEMDPLGGMKRNLEKFFAKTVFRPQPYPTLPWMTEQSPLSVPFEEHAVGADLAQCLLFLLKPENKELHAEFFSGIYNDYCRLLKMHVDKEDHCLFIIYEQAVRTTGSGPVVRI